MTALVSSQVRSPAVSSAWDVLGTVLDPVFALRQRVRIAPGQMARVAFWTLLAPTRGTVDAAGRVALLLQHPGDYLLHETVAEEAPASARERAGLQRAAYALRRGPPPGHRDPFARS